MVKINVLMENFSIGKQYISSHGLSVYIEHNDKRLLLDVGSNNGFLKNACQKNIDLTRLDYVFLSHNHIDHTGGINEFLKYNETSKVYLMDNINSRYYIKVLFFNIPINTRLKKKYNSRITELENDLNINNSIYFVKNISSEHKKPTFNKMLYKKNNGKIINDTFDHEGILVLEDNDELLIFNSCSHNGILNSIKTVKSKIPNKKIRCYLGGLHLYNPPSKENESKEYLDYLANGLKEMDIKIYTGHCTGKYSLNYLKNKLGDKVIEINAGMVLDI